MVELEQQKQLLEAKAATLEQTTQQLTEVEHDLAKERDQGRLVSTELAVTKRLLEKAQEAVVQLREEVGGAGRMVCVWRECGGQGKGIEGVGDGEGEMKGAGGGPVEDKGRALEERGLQGDGMAGEGSESAGCRGKGKGLVGRKWICFIQEQEGAFASTLVMILVMRALSCPCRLGS